MGSIFKLTALAGVAAGAYAAVKKFAPNILPDKNEAADMAKNAVPLDYDIRGCQANNTDISRIELRNL